MKALADLQDAADPPWQRDDIEGHADQVATFACDQAGQADQTHRKCRLTDAQFVIARAHGFASWPKFASHLESIERSTSAVSHLRPAAEAIVIGDAATLGRLLREHPGLVRTRSTREHHATLLHYVLGERGRKLSPEEPEERGRHRRMLLDAGAEVDARADVYGGGCTALGLVATSAPPAIAGVQQGVMGVLLAHGARMDAAGIAGNDHALVRACLANGQPEAADYLVSRGAPLDLPGAAGMGRVDALAPFFHDGDGLKAATSSGELADGFSLACAYGRTNAVVFLLDHGVHVDIMLKGHGEGHTGLHVAAFHGHAGVVQALLGRGARVDVIDKTWVRRR